MVLLKNDGVLPLKTSGTKIAVVGPLADQTRVLLGNYNGIPTHTVSVLEGLRKEFPGAHHHYVPGTQFLSKDHQPVPAALLYDGWQAGREGQPTSKATCATYLAAQAEHHCARHAHRAGHRRIGAAAAG